MQRVGRRRPEAESRVELRSALVKRMNEKHAYADPVGGGECRQDGVANQKSSQAPAPGLVINGEPPEQNGRDRIRRIAAHPSRNPCVLDRDCRQRVIADDPAAIAVHADVATRHVGEMVGERPVNQIAIK